MAKRGIKHKTPLPKTLAEHESICKRCGNCCRLKTYKNKKLTLSEENCPHLGFKNGKVMCMIYKTRLDSEHCRPLSDALAYRFQPSDCPYVKNLEGYKALGELDYDQPYPAWKRDGAKGNLIKLPNILKAFENDMVLCEDFISIVGGLCNHGETRGDIDVLIKTPEPKNEGSPEGMATKFRVSRILAKLGIPEERIQFLYDDFHGPFTSHVHLFDLVLKLKPQVLHEMQSELAQRKVVPFKFFTQPKPVHGRYKEEIYAPETVAKVIKNLKRWNEQLPQGIYVEKKFDGVRCQVHKVGKTLKVLTEEGGEITNKIPTLKKQLSAIPHNYVAEFEIELWKGNEHQSRSDTAGALHLKGVPPEESGFVANLYDCVWFNNKDIHEMDFSERIKFMNRLGASKNIKQSKRILVKNFEDLKKAVSSLSKEEGSEGAMLKLPFYKYPLKPHTFDMMKFKNEFFLNVEIVQKHDVKETDAFNYLTVVREGKEKIPAGRTYNTKLDIGVGGFLKVAFVNLNKYNDPTSGKVWYNMWSPRPISKSDKVDSVETAERLVKSSDGDIAKKSFPSRYESLLDIDDELIKEFERLCILENTEEFNYGLLNNWIKREDFIPKVLAKSNVLRNQDDFILRKDFPNSSLVVLRDDTNKIKKNILTELMQTG